MNAQVAVLDMDSKVILSFWSWHIDILNFILKAQT